MFDWIASLIAQGKYLGIAILMCLENVFPPIPSELIMPMGGFLADQGKLSFAGVVVAGIVGSFVGQLLLYGVGYKVGKDRLKRWARDHGHWVAVSEEEIDRASDFFNKKRGGGAVLVGRLVPAIRSLISIPAGIVKMPLPSFALYTLIGTSIWTTALAFAGRLVGQNYEKVAGYLDPVTYVVVFGITAAYLWRVFKSFRRPDAAGAAG